MQQTCPRCGNVIDGSSRFCTNCGTVLQAGQGNRQSWEAPPPQSVPSWASSGSYPPYQQQTGPGPQNTGLGFGGPADAQARRLLTIAVSVILGAVLLLIVSIALAFVGPASTRGFFLVVALLLILIPWIIYHQIRRIIRRTVGRIWWFM
jgi:ribosomal protein S27AE